LRSKLPTLVLALCGIAVGQPAQTEPPQPAPKQIHILLGGDVMLSRNVGIRARAQKDPAAPFREIAPLFAAADIAFVNLEAPFSDRGPFMLKGMIFKDEPEMIAGLDLAGIDIVSTANNHSRDRGGYGIQYTLDLLAQHGIFAVGTAYSPDDVHYGAVLVRDGVRFGFLAYTYDANNGNYKDTDDRVSVMNIEQLKQDIAAMKQRADVVLVSMHAGIEYQLKPNKQQIAFAHAAIDAGAQVVIGHHPHVRQPSEEYGGGVIFYSLGNLIFDQSQRVETQIGSLAEVVFEGTKLVSSRLMTVDIAKTVPKLRPAETPKANVAEPRPTSPNEP
jgi:poly-gamma-glutamate synthesis protein (capsule biosynthesis protein)